MLINLRNALMAGKRLPYDAEVEYLSSSENAGASGVPPVYIDTGVALSSGIKMSVTAAFNSTANQLMGFYGGSSGRFDIGINDSRVFVTSIGATTTRSTADTNIHEFVLDAPNAMAYIDGVGVATGAFSVSISGNIILFSRGRGDYTPPLDYNQWYSKVNIKIHSCKIWDNNVLVRDFIPVRKGTVGYLYDRVSGKLFGNAGTGDFVLGQDVVPVEYLEGTGTQYIDTGLGYFADFEVGIKLRTSVPNKALGTTTLLCMERFSAGNPVWTLHTGSGPYLSTALITDYHIMSWRNGAFAVDGVTAQTVENTFASGTMTLFGAGESYYPNMIYACKLWDSNDLLVRKFLPVRVGTEGAMMDTLTRRIYRNAGTGAFGYGNDLKYPIPAE